MAVTYPVKSLSAHEAMDLARKWAGKRVRTRKFYWEPEEWLEGRLTLEEGSDYFRLKESRDESGKSYDQTQFDYEEIEYIMPVEEECCDTNAPSQAERPRHFLFKDQIYTLSPEGLITFNTPKKTHMSLLKKLLPEDVSLLQDYVFDDEDLDFGNPLVQQALLETPGFKEKLLELCRKEKAKAEKKAQ